MSMKLKRIPGDFQVEERSALQPVGGPFALYRLTKSSLGTPEAIDAVLQRWKLPRQAAAFAGLKDRHALTSQAVTIYNGPRRSLKQQNLELEYVGQAPRAVHAGDILGNAFVVVLRDLVPAERDSIQSALAAAQRDGLPNYFDNQRFGSVGESGEFIARPWCQGDYERALWLAIAEANVHDRPDERNQKQHLRERWGDWEACAAALPPSYRREIAALLARQPGDFRRALTLVRQDLRSLWLAAWQSDLWNAMLAALIRETVTGGPLATATIGRRDLPFFGALSPDERDMLQQTVLPLPSARLHLEAGPLKSLIDRVLAAEGTELRQVRVKYPRDTFFSKGERPALFLPQELTHAVAPDELYPGREKLTLRFVLGRGSYATILVKRLTGEDAQVADIAEE
jgi:tRNA pseudouridine13 synthase